MKNIFTYVFLIPSLLSVLNVHAQKGLSLNLKASPQFSFLFNENNEHNKKYDRKATFRAGFGLGAEYGFNTHMGVGLDVYYSLQGQRYKFDNKEYNQRLDYIKIPILFTYQSNVLKPVSLIGRVGPQLSILTAAQLKDDEGLNLPGGSESRFESTTFGGVAAVGAQFKLNRRSYLTSSVRFDYDFTNAEDDTYPGYNQAREKTHSSTLGLEVGFRYLLN